MGMHEHQNYEVRVYNNGRWQVHARYDYRDRALAIADAKDLDRERRTIAIRVILEEYKPSTGRHNETLIYRNQVEPTSRKVARLKSMNNWADMSVSSDGRVGFMLDDLDYFGDNPLEENSRPKPKATKGLLIGIIFNILASGGIIGAAASGMLYLIIRVFKINLLPNVQNFVLIAMFVVVAIIALSATFSYYNQRFDLNVFAKKAKPKAAKKENDLSPKIAQEMERAAQDIDKSPLKTPLADLPPEEDFEFVTPKDPEAVSETAQKVEQSELSDKAETLKTFMISFLGTMLGALKSSNQDDNKYNKFCLNMFLCGAVMRLSKEHGLNDKETVHILYRILEMLGSTQDQIQKFLNELSSHLATPRHKKLYDESGNIAYRLEGGEQSASLTIKDTIDEWANNAQKVAEPKPLREDEHSNLLTIMFTDMVGSTDLTSKHGDYAAQEVLKSHDMIVRTALTNYNGKEIKHLGDGIMASFKRHQDAVDAAITIQQRILGNNNADPEIPLHIRIGLHSGEPIRKNNDLFGAAVQLAARVCNFCASDEIVITDEVVKLCANNPRFVFEDIGLQSLKGFSNQHHLYRVKWDTPSSGTMAHDINTATQDNAVLAGMAAEQELAMPPKPKLAEKRHDGQFSQGLSLIPDDQ